MQLTGKVGPVATTSSLASATEQSLRMGNMGDTIISPLHGNHFEANYRRTLFAAANQSAATTTIGLATTYTGLAISNPVGSQVNVVLNRVGMAFIVAFPAAAAFGIMAGYNSSTNVTHTTAVTPRSQYYGVGASPVALVDAAATLPTAPILVAVLGAGLTGVITTTTQSPLTIYDLHGSLILPPGGYAAIYTSAVSGTSGFFGSWLWEEVPL